MRKIAVFSTVLAMLCFAVTGVAETKLAVVDLEALVAAHPNTQADKALLEEQLAEYEAQKEKIEARLKVLNDAYDKAVAAARDSALSEKKRREKTEVAADAARNLESARRGAYESVQDMQKDLTRTELRMFKRTLNAITNEVSAFAQENGYDLILDSSGEQSTGKGMVSVPSVVFASEQIDITPMILKRIGGESLAEKPEESTEE